MVSERRRLVQHLQRRRTGSLRSRTRQSRRDGGCAMRRLPVSVLSVLAVTAVLFTILWASQDSADSRSAAAVDQGSLFHLIDPPTRIFDSRTQLVLETPGAGLPAHNVC